MTAALRPGGGASTTPPQTVPFVSTDVPTLNYFQAVTDLVRAHLGKASGIGLPSFLADGTTRCTAVSFSWNEANVLTVTLS